jgi:hypothetical protein
MKKTPKGAFSYVCLDPGSNWGPLPLQGSALPTELSKRGITKLFNGEFFEEIRCILQRLPNLVSLPSHGLHIRVQYKVIHDDWKTDDNQEPHEFHPERVEMYPVHLFKKLVIFFHDLKILFKELLYLFLVINHPDEYSRNTAQEKARCYASLKG